MEAMQEKNGEDGKTRRKVKYVMEKFRKGKVEAIFRGEKIRGNGEEKRARKVGEVLKNGGKRIEEDRTRKRGEEERK